MIGPATTIPVGGGKTADLYLLRFGKDGRLESPQTAAMAVEAAAGATDVYLFSHGWNNVYADALKNYTDFAKGFVKQRAEFGLKTPADYRPVLIGVIWPATWFVFGKEKGPKIAGGPTGAAATDLMAQATEDLTPEARAEIFEIVDGASVLTEKQARRIATLMKPLWGREGEMKAPDVNAILSAWKVLGDPDPQEEFTPAKRTGTLGSGSGTKTTGTADIDAAGGGGLDPVTWARMGSVWQIKARAGDVGKNGVGPLLKQVLAAGNARVHLVGHSFGCRVMLSAVARTKLSRNVHSMLLLQPAINRWCFATKVIGTDSPGGYADVPRRVDRPIIATYSTKDWPLHEVFHLFVRGDSLGEFNAAAVGDTEKYGALGGYGPAGVDFVKKKALPAGKSYALKDSDDLVAVEGSGLIDGKPAIPGHGDVISPTTWWMLHQLVAK